MDFSQYKHHALSEQIVKVLKNKTLNKDSRFFRNLVSYYLGVVAATMRVNITGFGTQSIPVNSYVLNLAPSGFGKGLSTGIMEHEILEGFRNVFMQEVMENSARKNILKMATERAIRKNTCVDGIELPAVEKEYLSTGGAVFVFDSATVPAVKQLRHKYLMADCGALNLQVDEIASNLLGQKEVLVTFLELYDRGFIKDKLIKSSAESMRAEKLEGSTPANMLLFGTFHDLLDGGVNEEALLNMLATGYARRCLFGLQTEAKAPTDVSVDELIDSMFDMDTESIVEELKERFTMLASEDKLHTNVHIPRDSLHLLVEYRLHCETLALEYPTSKAIQSMEMRHRYFKVLKSAGGLAFVDGVSEISRAHIEASILLVEESGQQLNKICTPDRNYMRLARYLVEVEGEVTLADLDTDLPYFKGSKATKEDMINMAIAYGYKNNIVIQRSFIDGILFLSGSSLQKTDLDKLIISCTDNPNMTTDYQNLMVKWEDIEDFGKDDSLHWLNHHMQGGYRKEDNALLGFNLLVFDVDGTFPLEASKSILEGYKAFFYTTKRHTEECNRYRIVIPTNFILRLNKEDYNEFTKNIYEHIPFTMDEQSSHRCKKWLSNKGEYQYIGETDGELFDVVPFIPKTKKNEDRKETLKSYGSIDALETWFLNNTGNGNRNHQLHKFARVLIDRGLDFQDISDAVHALNDKMPDKLSADELNTTVMKTVARHM